MKPSAFNCFLTMLLLAGMTLGASAGGLTEDADELARELARTQNELDRQKARSDDLERRLDSMGNRLSDLAAREPAYTPQTTVRRMSLLDEDFPIHGYITVTLADPSRDIAGESTFHQEEFVLLYDYALNEEYSVHGDIAFLNGTEIFVDGGAVDGVGDLVVQEAYVNWSPERARDMKVNVLAGKFSTPFGVWTPQEIAPTTHSVFDPLLDRWAIHSEFTTGAQINSECEVGPVTLFKAFFVGNGEGPQPHSQDFNNNKVIGAQVRGTLGIVNDGTLSLGVSGEIGRESFSDSDLQEKIYGVDGRLDIAGFTLRAETARSRMNGLDRHYWQFVWYAMASYNFMEKYDVFFRFDEGDENQSQLTDSEVKIRSVGMAYRPIQPVVFKAQYERYKDSNPLSDDYDVWAGQVSALF